MIHEIGVEIGQRMRARGVPVSVVDREPHKPATFGNERVVIERFGDDSFSSPRGNHDNARHRWTRSIACKITIYAKSGKGSALEFEHLRRCDDILDQVLVALYEVAKARKNLVSIKAGRNFVPEGLADSDRYAGAAYELLFTFDRGVHEHTWKGDAKPTQDVAADLIKNTTNVKLAGGPIGTPVEVGCGAEE